MTLFEIDRSIQELIENGFNGECLNAETGEVDGEVSSARQENASINGYEPLPESGNLPFEQDLPEIKSVDDEIF